MILAKQAKYGSLNFIDEFDNFVGWDNSPNCCEQFGYFISDKLLGEDMGTVSLDNFYWDTTTPVYELDADGTPWAIGQCGGVVAFRMVDATGAELFLHLYNDHNGYYSHGWEAPYLNASGGL